MVGVKKNIGENFSPAIGDLCVLDLYFFPSTVKA